MVRDRLSVSQLRVRFIGFMAVLGCLLVAWAGLGLASEVVADDAMDLKQQVIAEVNLRRTEAGVPPVEISPFLSTAAQAHAEYLIANAAQWAYGLDAHYEVPSYPSYYAASPAERAVKAGMASGNDISEDVLLGYGNTSGGAAFVVGAWINAPLHRRAIIDRAMVEAGFGWATDDPKYAYVYNAVSDRSADARSGEVQEYPADGMTGIPWGWDGIESPQPFPPDRYPDLWEGNRFVGGYPLTFYPVHGTFVSSSLELRCAMGAVPVVRSAAYPYVFVPADRLQPGTTYSGRFVYSMRLDFTGEVYSGVREFAFGTAGGSTTSLPPSTTLTTSTSTTTTTSTTTAPSTTTTTTPTGPTVSTTTTTMQTGPVSFSDVGPRHPYAQAIEALAARGVISGIVSGNERLFKPNEPVLRQQLAKMLVLGLGLVVTTSDECLFEDVELSSGEELYPDHYVAVAAREGMVVGTSLRPLKFSPYDNVLRAQLLTMVVRAGRALGRGALSAPPEGWKGELPTMDPTHGENIRWAEYNGLVALMDLKGWDVWKPASRGEVAQVLWTLVK